MLLVALAFLPVIMRRAVKGSLRPFAFLAGYTRVDSANWLRVSARTPDASCATLLPPPRCAFWWFPAGSGSSLGAWLVRRGCGRRGAVSPWVQSGGRGAGWRRAVTGSCLHGPVQACVGQGRAWVRAVACARVGAGVFPGGYFFVGVGQGRRGFGRRECWARVGLLGRPGAGRRRLLGRAWVAGAHRTQGGVGRACGAQVRVGPGAQRIQWGCWAGGRAWVAGARGRGGKAPLTRG